MKTYKKVEMEAVNAPTGSYAAGCPAHTPVGGPGGGVDGPGWHSSDCRNCEVTK